METARSRRAVEPKAGQPKAAQGKAGQGRAGQGIPAPAGSASGRSASRVYVELEDAIGPARDFAATFLRTKAAEGMEIGPRTVDDARLVVSELVTNAVRHASGPCRVDLRIAGGILEIAVSDASEFAPIPRPPDPRRVGQHGLEIVLALCVGVDIEPLPSGKRVRARLALR